MTVGFSKEWAHYSWHNSHGLDMQNEQALIIEMIRNCNNMTIRAYALNEREYGVYVRTGLHSSKTEPRQHVQVVLGSNDPSAWKASDSDAGYTGHIIYHDPTGNATKRYEADLFNGQHHLKRVGVGGSANNV